jgi:hypothetical protein
MTPEHLQSLTELLAASAITTDPTEFRRYGSARKLYKFNIDHASDY